MLRNLPKLPTESAQRRENKTALLVPGLVRRTQQLGFPAVLASDEISRSAFHFYAQLSLKPRFLFLPYMFGLPSPLIILHKCHRLLFLSPPNKNKDTPPNTTRGLGFHPPAQVGVAGRGGSRILGSDSAVRPHTAQGRDQNANFL